KEEERRRAGAACGRRAHEGAMRGGMRRSRRDPHAGGGCDHLSSEAWGRSTCR
uniref:Uncharacterized protein n=1 Tax=Triticum urartu TaxID=4572 RepID=A0A8R7Q319_TRIUA